MYIVQFTIVVFCSPLQPPKFVTPTTHYHKPKTSHLEQELSKTYSSDPAQPTTTTTTLGELLV